MTAKEIISPQKSLVTTIPLRHVDSEMPVLDVLPRLLDTPQRMLGVVANDGSLLGVIDGDSMLDGLGRLIAARDDCSTIVVECAPADFSASAISHAVEDSDAHLVDMLTTPGDDGKLRVTLRVRHTDPTQAAHSLERYNFNVVYTHGNDNTDAIVAVERLAALQAYLNV